MRGGGMLIPSYSAASILGSDPPDVLPVSGLVVRSTESSVTSPKHSLSFILPGSEFFSKNYQSDIFRVDRLNFSKVPSPNQTMEDDAPVIYGLEFQARALAARTAETDRIHFLVGSQSLRSDNQVHLIDFDDEHNLINKSVFLHKDGEVWQIGASPRYIDVISTVYNKTTSDRAEMHAAFWKVPESAEHSDDSTTAPSLELITRLDKVDYGDMKHIMWHPMGENDNIIALADNKILLFDLSVDSESAKLVNSTSMEGKGQPKFTSGSWNPHHNCTQLATVNDTHVKAWDLRSMTQAWQIENAHNIMTRDLDFNPNKQYYLATCGDDNKAKFWDFRNPSEPVKTLTDHSHWVWSVRFNHFHDQLVLTSSSDSRVILTNTSSISSEPFDQLIEDEGGSDNKEAGSGDETIKERPSDGIICTYDEHEDSVYKAEWSSADPWVFASLSYDGRLVINRVPRAEKYKILL